MAHSTIINLSGYRFVHLVDPDALKAQLQPALADAGVKGAVLLASEGINIALAGTCEQIQQCVSVFDSYHDLRGINFKRSASDFVPHRRLRIRVRTEIISFEGADSRLARLARPAAPVISPEVLDQWLDNERKLILLDTRNDYEVESGTFRGAVHLDIKHFRHFTDKAKSLLEARADKALPVVTFCTGGIRCEKAAPWLLAQGFDEVYQLDGGIVNYLQHSDGRHWAGNCFVFDDRVELTPSMEPTGAGLCDHCQLAVPVGEVCTCHLGPHFHAA